MDVKLQYINTVDIAPATQTLRYSAPTMRTDNAASTHDPVSSPRGFCGVRVSVHVWEFPLGEKPAITVHVRGCARQDSG